MEQLQHFINGAYSASGSVGYSDIFDPSTGAIQHQMAIATADEIDQAVAAAEKALPEWMGLSIQRRAHVMFNFKRLLEENMQPLAELLSSEHGKTIADSKGDITRGLEVVEFMCGYPHLIKGEYSDNAGRGIDVYSMRQPLGVCAGITPFNFPAMIPMWMFAVAVACGNTFILKPSEKDPSVPLRLAELFIEAGAPKGVLNVVLGQKGAVDALLRHPRIAAISFVGSSDVAHYVYRRAAEAGKRVQAMGGAKNHGIVMPDADLDRVVNQLLGAAYGSGGERCMAMPVVVPVGEQTASALRDKLIAAVSGLQIGVSTDSEADFGPLVTAVHRERVVSYIQKGIDEGAELLIDGRGFQMTDKRYADGFFLGATLFDKVTAKMTSYQEEIFGPVLQIVRANSFDEAIALPSRHQYGNGASIFTNNGHYAREFARRVHAGMIGVNIPIPVPLSYYSFGGWKRSSFASANQYGVEGVRFWSRAKTVTQRWPSVTDNEVSRDFNIPTGGQ